ncbi:MAG: hypothetical protein E5Y12_26380 [Mesorhizobium sp.]|nr:MAG: hypothetical protein E5Y12_26380 [Mesorhizobium sp.]
MRHLPSPRPYTGRRCRQADEGQRKLVRLADLNRRAGLTIFRWRLQGSAQAAQPFGPRGP